MRPSRRSALRALGAGGLLPLTRSVEAGPAPSAPKSVAVCFSSGSLHGFAHVGAIRAFRRLGFKPAIIAGTSVGAIAGVLWAAELESSSIETIAGDPSWREFGWLRLPRLGFAQLHRLQALIDTHVGKLETLPTRFCAVATDVDTGRPVVLDRGPAGRAVAASASVPIRYEPILIDGVRLVDGALSAPVPIDAARAAGADFTIAFDVAYRPYEAPVSGITDVMYQTFNIMVNRLIDEQIRRADYAIRLDVHALVKENANMQAVVLAGEAAVLEHWPALQRKLAEPIRPQRC